MKTLARIGACVALISVMQVVRAEPDGVGYAPQPGTHFQSALSDSQVSAEMANLNVAPADSMAPRMSLPKVEKVGGSVSLFGSVRNNLGADVCGLILANGNFMFSCSPTGTYSLTTGLDANNQVTLFGFADGHFPFKVVLGSAGGRYDIVLNVATTVAPPPPPTTYSGISFTITDSCHDGFAIDYKFFDEDNNLVWPTATTHYFTQYDDTPYTNNLSCVTGALICYGARNSNPANPGYWGVDVDNSKACSDCCIRCQSGASLSRALTCS